mmetsp:Transcript_6593/g.24463  ORF Transcript_6593/g.24463 Transcript_6593/m.24463 type:complete len:174 (+) Transcript_6593:248-769(+)
MLTLMNSLTALTEGAVAGPRCQRTLSQPVRLLRGRAARSRRTQPPLLVRCAAEPETKQATKTGKGMPKSSPDADIVEAEPAKPKFKTGDFVQVDKEEYLGSVEALATNHPWYYGGLDYIYESRGEVLTVQDFPQDPDSEGFYYQVTWVGVPTAPAWLPESMLRKVPKLQYERE